jgi:hypothetical protein
MPQPIREIGPFTARLRNDEQDLEALEDDIEIVDVLAGVEEVRLKQD